MLTLQLFGRALAWVDGEPVKNLHRREAERLLAYLALHGGEPVAYRTVAELFYPADAKNPHSDFPGARQGVRALREALGAEVARLTNPQKGFLALDLTGADADVLAFDRRAASADPNDWAEAVALYTAPLLEGWTETWAKNARLRRKMDYERILRGLWERARQSGETEDAERWRALLLASDPAAVASAPIINNLPVPVTTFIGRETEMERVITLLKRARLVTLTGLGGSGKTRLSLEVAARSLPDFPGGVFLAELAAVSDAQRVPQTVAAAVGLRDFGGGDATAALARFIGARRMLLLMDNDEHLIDACAALADALLRSCHHLTILAASREPLNVPGEQNFRLPPLSLPAGQKDDLTAAIASESEAVRLFVDRAMLADADFALTDDNAPIVAALCRRVDGVPLALELAAARLRTMPLNTLWAQLQESFDLLVGGSRVAPPRQQTLNALIDWSYRLLTQEERSLFRRLSVFIGGWTLETAGKVVREGEGTGNREQGTEQKPEGEASSFILHSSSFLALHDALADKSLVTSDGEGRYNFLQIVRQFAAGRLQENPDEREDAQTRHTQTFVEIARRAGDSSGGKTAGLDGPDELRFLRELDAEYENMQAAMGRATGEDALHLAASLEPYWRIRDQSAEAGRRLTAALDRLDAQDASLARVRALVAIAGFSAIPGGLARAQEALTIARWLKDVQGEAVTLARLAGYHDAPLTHDELTAAVSLKRQSSALAQQVGDLALLTWNHLALAWLYRESGDSATALVCARDALAVARTTQNPRALTLSLIACAECQLDAAEATEGVTALLTEASAMVRALGNRRHFSRLAIAMARLAWREGDPSEALRILNDALRESETQYGDPTSLRKTQAELYQWRGYFSARSGDPATARAALRQAATLQAPTTLPLKRFHAYLRQAAALACAEGDFLRVPYFEAFAESLRDQIPMANPPSLIADRQSDLDAARAALGDARFAARQDSGRQLTEAEGRTETENFLLK